MEFDGIIFDFDGVLLQSVDIKTRAFARLYEPFGAEVVDQVVAYHLLHGGVSRFEKFRYYHRELLGRPIGEEDVARLSAEFSELVVESVIASPWVVGAEEALRAIHLSLPLFVASGTPDSELKAIMERREMLGYFRSVHGSPDTKAEILDGVLCRNRLDPDRVLMVGDSITDYEAAVQCGLQFLGIGEVAHGTFPHGVLMRPDLTGFATEVCGVAHRDTTEARD